MTGTIQNIMEDGMQRKMNMIYWKGEKYWIGKLLEFPEIMSQGETLEELEENIKDAYLLMTLDDVPEHHQVKELALTV
jgi:predicted RNase H-like HicB family nuclease